MPPLVVVAAVIERDGRILIGQRKPGRKHPLKWEFPGGKVEPGEEPRAALQRELREELAIEAEVGPQLDAYEFRYPGAERATSLLFFHVTQYAGEPQNLDFAQILWDAPAALAAYDFLEGDVDFVRRLATQPEHRLSR